MKKMNDLEKKTFFAEAKSMQNVNELDVETFLIWFLLNHHFLKDNEAHIQAARAYFIYVRSIELLESIETLANGYSEN